VRAIRLTREIASTEPLASATAVEIQPAPDVTTDAALKAWIRATIATTGHPACSAAMDTEPDSVLIHSCGCGALRVCGWPTHQSYRASRAPTPMPPAVMVGERCADFMSDACASCCLTGKFPG
jgi:choline dehydrogenase